MLAKQTEMQLGHPLVIDTTFRDVVAPWVDAAVRRVRPETARRVAPPAELDSTTIAAILDRMRRVEGWLQDEEAELLLGDAACVTEQGGSVEINVVEVHHRWRCCRRPARMPASMPRSPPG
jgi:hypothetical protein